MTNNIRCDKCEGTGRIRVPKECEVNRFETLEEKYSQSGYFNHHDAKEKALDMVDTEFIDCPKCK